ncbi:hypothetical protein EVA_13424 [gut metagenome]|uniref:Uncharacterized protein n=1 Tax=gut metagenome TaxID=749906 RepID=J9FVC8_9ZZZZ
MSKRRKSAFRERRGLFRSDPLSQKKPLSLAVGLSRECPCYLYLSFL